MLNNEVYMRTSAEVCSQVASYFDVVDNCVAVSDTNKQYSINPQTSYSPSPPIKSGSYTSVIISPNTHNTADLYNGFIRADMKCRFKMIDTNAIEDLPFGYNGIWFGFKDARDAIEKYEIVANGMTIYTQNFGCEESFITACACSEESKKADIFSKARHKDIWYRKLGCRCGVFINWLNRSTYEGTIKLKIDLRRFLPLSNIKYLPAFAGKIELRLYFSTAGMVYCPVGPKRELHFRPEESVKYRKQVLTTEFTPIGEPIYVYTHLDSHQPPKADTNPTHSKLDPASVVSPQEIHTDARIIIVDDYEITECSSIIPCFGIDNEVYNKLVQRYSSREHPLTFPTQMLSFYTTTHALNQANDKTTITITPRFVDSIFCLFPLKHTHHTWFKNPQFKSFQLNCGGYGNIPAKACGTTPDYPEFFEYCQNALNMNGTQSGLKKEVVASLVNQYQPLGGRSGYYPDDRSSFFIGFATETDGTYQQVMTSLSPINFEIIVSQDTDDGNCYAKNCQTPPVIGLLQDGSISILVEPNGAPPRVAIGNYDITTPE